MFDYQKSVKNVFHNNPYAIQKSYNVDRKHMWYKICDDIITIGCSANIVLEKKNY